MKNNSIVTLAAFVIVMAGFKAASAILVPFLLAVFIAIVSTPAINFLQNKGVSKFMAFLMVLALVVSVFISIGYITGNAINSFISKIPELQEKLNSTILTAFSYLNKWGVNFDKNNLTFFQELDPNNVLNTMGIFLKSTSKILSNSFLIFLMVTFILFESQTFDEKLTYLERLNPKNKEYVLNFLSNLKRYLAIKTAASLATGIIIGLALSVLNISYALLWGLLAFLLNYIPTIGSILAAIPAILITFIEVSFIDSFWVFLVFVSVNVVIGNFIEPRFLGIGLGISTIVVLLSLLFWGMIFGAAGMFLAIPLTMSLKIALDTSPNTRWIAVMLSDKARKKRSKIS